MFNDSNEIQIIQCMIISTSQKNFIQAFTAIILEIPLSQIYTLDLKQVFIYKGTFM